MSSEQKRPKEAIVRDERDSTSEYQGRDPVIRLEIYGILILAFTFALVLGLVSFKASDVDGARSLPTQNWLGPIGAHIADTFLSAFGVGSFALVVLFGYYGWSYLRGRKGRAQPLDWAGVALAMLSTCVLSHLVGYPNRFLERPPGGGLGSMLGELCAAFLSRPGTFLLFVALSVVAIVLLTRKSVFELASVVGQAGKKTAQALSRAVRMGEGDSSENDDYEPAPRQTRPRVPTQPAVPVVASEPVIKQAPRLEAASAQSQVTRQELPALTPAATQAEPRISPPKQVVLAQPDEAESQSWDDKGAEDEAGPVIQPPRARPNTLATSPKPVELPVRQHAPKVLPPVHLPPEPSDEDFEVEDEDADALFDPYEDFDADEGYDDEPYEAPVAVPAKVTPKPTAPVQTAVKAVPVYEDEEDQDEEGDFKIVESDAMRRTRELSEEEIEAQEILVEASPVEKKPFVLPSLSMLDYRPPETQTYDRELLKRNAQILEAKLLDYRVKGKVVEIHPGPVITMYEFMPAAGVKVSAIAGLANDLAMALSAISIRIVAPIPGKNVVGIEIPNATRETVWLKEILSDGSYARAKSRMTLALGKDIVGNPTSMDLAKAPHLLVAGATGAGKSVAINSFIVSILFKAEPTDVRLIMVDPKILELSIYEGIPHLLLPVVTDPKDASTALKWAVKEMDRRYRLMSDMGVRNLEGYNIKVDQLLAQPGQRLPDRLHAAKIKREAKGEVDPPGVILDADGRPVERLPAIVVIIDELADLMMVAGKEVEQCIARLAQKARASGIHLILATQRPSVDVITGLIKANFPTRISFRVASQIDSRTILDQKGAEALLGMGDMLFLPPGSSLQRVHGCYVSEDEVHAIVSHLKEQGTPDYDMGILASDEDDSEKAAEQDEDTDEFYAQAVRFAAESRSISTSSVQRKFRIGYNRAARIIEQMERNGIIGPSDGTSRGRDVYIDPQ